MDLDGASLPDEQDDPLDWEERSDDVPFLRHAAAGCCAGIAEHVPAVVARLIICSAEVQAAAHYTHLGPPLGALFGVRAQIGAQLAVGPLVGGQLRLGPPTNLTWPPQVSDEHLGAQVTPN